MSNYHRIRCVTCADDCPNDGMRPNQGYNDLQRIIDHAAELHRIELWCMRHGFDVELSTLYVCHVDLSWLHKHLGHELQVWCEYDRPCNCGIKRCECRQLGGYDANGSPSWDGNGAPV